jgi:predicted nucleic acid-binding protein
MIFIDASFYLSYSALLDSCHEKAISSGSKYLIKPCDLCTSQSILGEVLTVGSQRYNRTITIEFVNKIIQSETKIILENQAYINKTLEIFKQITNKNISYVDCYSAAIINKHKIDTVLTFDLDFLKLKLFLPKNVAFPLL